MSHHWRVMVKTTFEDERAFAETYSISLANIYQRHNIKLQLNSYLSDVDKSNGCRFPAYFCWLSHPVVPPLDLDFSAANVRFFGCEDSDNGFTSMMTGGWFQALFLASLLSWQLYSMNRL